MTATLPHGKTLRAWSEESGVPYNTLCRRVHRGIPLDVALKGRVNLSRMSEAQSVGGIGSLTWQTLPWEQDQAAQRLVREYPAGLVLSSVGAAMGLTKERVRQLEFYALRKLRIGMRIEELLGPNGAEVMLRGLRGAPLSAFQSALVRAERMAGVVPEVVKPTERRPARNKTGHRGVSQQKRDGRFRAMIRVGGRCKHIGTYATMEEAREAVQKAEAVR